jgi:peptidoglycan hydrolase-like protein with peptidoglycan-binding domain
MWCLAALCVAVCISVQADDTTTPTKKPATSAKKATVSDRKSGTKSSAKKGKYSSKAKGRTSKKRGQKAIDSERTEQIQEALIREHYLNGSPTGKWDAATEAALRKYQGEQGWQTKTVPDSRALIKLGLGPSHDHLLNPESAMTTTPVVAPKTATSAHSPDPPAQAPDSPLPSSPQR